MSLINNIVLAALNSNLRDFDKGKQHPVEVQMGLLDRLVNSGEETLFGKEHHFGAISSYEKFEKRVPIRLYDDFVPYIDRLRKGENYIL